MKKNTPFHIVFWYFMIVTISSLAVYMKVGSRTLLKQAAIIKPYAHFYLSSDWSENAQEESNRKLIFFFGDSTLELGQDKNHKGAAEMLEEDLRKMYPDLGEVAVIRKSFGSATLFHFYCMLFMAEKHSPDLVIIPINWMWLGMNSPTGCWVGKQSLRAISGIVPLREFFSSNKGNPLRLAGISLEDRILYMIDMPLLCMTGMKLWIREKLHLPELVTSSQPIDWLPLQPGYADLCPENPSVDLLRYTAETAEKLNIRVLFYIVPAMQMLPDSSPLKPDRFTCSVQHILDASQTSTTRGLNLVRLLDAKQFTDGLHYGASGHRDIARALAPEVYLELSHDEE